jgi:hypothetical protein
MKKHGIRFVSLLLLLSSITVQAVAVPQSEKEIPVFAGSVRDKALETELIAQDKETAGEMQKTWRSNTMKVYKAKTLINEVCKFYIGKLKAKEGMPTEDPGMLKPGMVITPWYELGYHDARIFEDQYERDLLIQDGKWIKSAFAKRPQWKKGFWLNQATFEWNAVLANGDMAQYTVILEDEGYDSRKKIDFKTTRIIIRILVTKSEDAMDEEEDEEY